MGFLERAGRWVVLGLSIALAGPVAAQQDATLPTAPSAIGTITGVVTDFDGDEIPGAHLTLKSGTLTREFVADESGNFELTGVPPGPFHLVATASGFGKVDTAGTMPGGPLRLPAIALPAASTDSVQVTLSQEDLAEAEIHVEEHQNLFGVIPNYYVVYDWKAPPLTKRQKFQLAWKTNLAPATIIINAGIAGVEQATDTFPGYRQGASGYFKRFGANTADTAIGTMTGGFLLPVLFKQDPRYFYKGTGSITSRVLYAFSTCVIARGDNGKWQPAYAGILGDFASGAASNLYYPKSDRSSAATTLINGAISVVSDGFGNIVQEFLLKHLTPHSANYPHP